MDGFILVCALVLAFSSNQTAGDKMGEENKKDIAEVETLLKETVKVDLTELFTKNNKLVEDASAVFTKSLEYMDKNILELRTHLETRIKDTDDNTMNNLKELESNTKTMLENMNKTLMTNMEKINNKTMEERNEIISWAHHRAHVHEDILKTRITACAYDHGHFGKGVVEYSSKDGGYVTDSVSIRVFNKTEEDIKVEDVLNLGTGIFKIPENAAGEYFFTFGVTIDSFDQKLMSSSYIFTLNGAEIKGTEIYSDVGTSSSHDRAPGSRQVFLKLEDNDEVNIIQTRETDIEDFHVLFCGALLHLEKASESPGGMFSDSTIPEFPSANLADQESWEYEAPVLNMTVNLEFNYTEKESREQLVSITELEAAKITAEAWKTDDADWRGTNSN